MARELHFRRALALRGALSPQMLRVGVGISTDRDAERAGALAASGAMQSGDLSRANLLLVFATTTHGPGFTRVTRVASEVCGSRDVIGCSAAGLFAREREVEGGAGVAVVALAGDFAARPFFVPTLRGRGEAVAEEIRRAVGDAPGATRLLLVFADSYHLEPESLLQALGRRLPDALVVGGGASEDGSVGEVSVFAGNASSSNAVAGALLVGDFRTTVAVAQAVRPVGGIHRVTRARGNVILSLGERPAAEVFAAIVPGPLLEDPRRALAVLLVGLRDDEGEFVVRHLMGLDPETGALAVAAPIAEGQELFFCVRDPHAAREDLQRVLAAQAAAWAPAGAAGGLYVSCVGRGRAFHGMSGLETAYIGQHLGTLPVGGFFSGAEIASTRGGVRLHQYSSVLTLLG
jgi:small ligand-binding sensory domain FIST